MGGSMVTRLATAAALVVVAAALVVVVAVAAVIGSEASRGRHYRGAKCAGTRKYEVTLRFNWSGRTHPRSYSKGGNFSPPTVAAHTSHYQMWSPGSFASTGIQTVAKTGDPAPLREELKLGWVSAEDVETKPPTTIFSLNNRGFPADATPVGSYTIRVMEPLVELLPACGLSYLSSVRESIPASTV
ncbi:hypothetical protein MMPV_003062 [Pyropia vietnamensis]